MHFSLDKCWIFPASSLFPCSFQRWGGWGWCDHIRKAERARRSRALWILRKWSVPSKTVCHWVHVGLWIILLTQTLVLTVCLCLPSHTAASLCILRPLSVFWSPKHQHIHSLRHKELSKTPRSQSSASSIWPPAKATTPSPLVLTKRLPKRYFPPRVPSTDQGKNWTLLWTFWAGRLYWKPASLIPLLFSLCSPLAWKGKHLTSF